MLHSDPQCHRRGANADDGSDADDEGIGPDAGSFGRARRLCRRYARYDSAHTLGGLVHTGGLTAQEIFDALDVNHGANVATARKTIWDGIAAGMEHPREIPPRTPGTPGDLVEDDFDALDADQLRDRLRTVTAERDLWRRKHEKLDEWRVWASNLARLETQ